MSEYVDESTAEKDKALWDRYLMACDATESQPSLSDFFVWLEDNDIRPEYDDSDA